MTYSIVLCMCIALFVAIAIAHKPPDAHASDKKRLKVAHIWLEYLVVMQALIIVNQLLAGI